MTKAVTMDMIYEASEALKNVAEKTPVVSAGRIHPNIYFKLENLQKTGSFKLRGAYNKIRTLSDEEAGRGVIACSAGNHAQGVALSATKRGIKSVVCMPLGAPKIKVDATRGYGAQVRLVKGVYDDAAKEAERMSKEEGLVFIHPFDDPYVIAGQGTIGLEIIEQMPDVEQIIVPIGGGGLISGVAMAIKTLKPDCKVIGVQTAGVASMYGSMQANTIITVEDTPTVADGIHVLTPGKLTFEMVKKHVDDIVTVSEEEICAAIVSMIEGPKIIAEGAGATSAAAFLFDKVDKTKKTVAVISGGNVDISVLERVVSKGLYKTGKNALLRIDIPDRSTSFSEVVSVITDNNSSIYDITGIMDPNNPNINSTMIDVSIECSDFKDIIRIINTLNERGYRTENVF